MKKFLSFVLIAVVFFLVQNLSYGLFLQVKDASGQQVQPPAQQKVPPSSKYAMKVFKLKYISARDMVNTLNSLISEGENISVNEILNSFVLRASDKTIERISKVVSDMDKPPLQVQVEAKIIELKSGIGDVNNPSYLGASWKYKNANDPRDYAQNYTTDTITLGATSVGFYAQLLSGNIDLYLQALEKTIGYDLVASPWVTAINHEPAEILIGSKYGYKTSIISQTSTVQEIQFLEVGTKLKFTPHISEDGFIIMEVYPAISEGHVKNDLPQEDTTETKNKVLVKDTQTIVIGGLTKSYDRQVETGLPILSHIPFLGNLFKRTDLIKEKRDVMILITPKIVTPAILTEMVEKARLLEESRQKWSDGAKLIK